MKEGEKIQKLPLVVCEWHCWYDVDKTKHQLEIILLLQNVSRDYDDDEAGKQLCWADDGMMLLEACSYIAAQVNEVWGPDMSLLLLEQHVAEAR